MLHKISILILVLASAACVKVQKKGGGEAPNEQAPQEHVETAQSTPKDSDEFDFEYDFSEGEQGVLFHLPQRWGEVVVEKSTATETIFKRELTPNSLTWSDQLLKETKVNYKFFDKKNVILLKEIEVVPALDLNISADLDLAEKYSLNLKVKKLYIKNLVLLNSAKIFIGEFKGQILIENLQSEDGALQTFAEDARSSSGHGRSAGGFQVRIQAGEGTLNVNLFAEAGANGSPGAEPDATLKGSDGENGSIAVFTPGPYSIDSYSGLFTQVYLCSKPPSNSGNGKDGHKGFPGGAGKNGGSVNKIQIKNESPNLIIRTISRAGQKGFGGPGGTGGEPGKPGQAGDGGIRDFLLTLKLDPNLKVENNRIGPNVLGETCSPAKEGNWGTRGDQGDKGNDGIDGVDRQED